jgi:hypothetical protein
MRISLTDIKWWILHRIWPSNKYHIVNTGLPPGYYDADTRLLHSCFSILCDYYEREAPSIDWPGSYQSDTYDIITEIYNYWKVERPKLEERPIREVDKYDEYCKELCRREKELYETDQKYLHKIIDIMYCLWS